MALRGLVRMLMVAVVAATQMPASAVVLCARPRSNGTFNTSVKVREACRSNEMQLDPGALGLQGPKGDPGPSAVVRDVAGAMVGTIAEIPNPLAPQPMRVVRTVAGSAIALPVDTEGFVDDQAGTVAAIGYDSSDCSGTPLIGFGRNLPNNPPALLPTAFVRGDTAYYQAGPLAPHHPFSESATGYTSTSCASVPGTFTPPDTCCVSRDYGPDTLAEAVPVDLMALGLIPPFHVDTP
jgi:hypothetical protein